MHLDQHQPQITPINTIGELKKRFTQAPPTLQGRTNLIPTDHQEYSDDTVLCMERKENHELIKQLQNYSRVTKTRQIPIQWKNRNTHQEKIAKRINQLPPPYEQIEYKNTGKVLGEMINMNNNRRI